MTWQIKWDENAAKEFRNLDVPIQKKVLKYIRERLLENPRSFGHQLIGDKAGLWRYRVGDYRIICSLQNKTLTVLILAVGHRKDIYE